MAKEKMTEPDWREAAMRDIAGEIQQFYKPKQDEDLSRSFLTDMIDLIIDLIASCADMQSVEQVRKFGQSPAWWQELALRRKIRRQFPSSSGVTGWRTTGQPVYDCVRALATDGNTDCVQAAILLACDPMF